VVYKTSTKYKSGDVSQQDPPGGERLAPNSTVRLWVSTGTGDIRVKSVIGMDQYKAGPELNASGFKVDPKPAYNDTAPSGTVFNQDPLGSTKAKEGSIVTIWISKGPAPIPVPNVVGSLYNTVYHPLIDAGFKVSKQVVPSDQPKGTIIVQNPTAAAPKQQPGTTITLQVSAGPQLVPVPSVVNSDAATAEATLTAAGFSYDPVPQDTPNASENGIVLKQTPEGNKQAAPGSTVTIYVGNYVAP
ncbi:MAG TPA: PASTA domain-containing protein, partial [Gaiellaceae bacterium]